MAEKQTDSRLESALPYLTAGGVVADIGTDHAHLPIHIIRQGISRRAVACDINRGPIDAAKRNIQAAGFSDRIDTMQTDGLHGVEQFHPDDILIFGMGGELIVRILSEAPWVKNPAVGLILQPMTKAESVRAWLLDNGFSIVGETLSYEDQYYQTIHARYGGERIAHTPAELLLGKMILKSKSPYLKGYIERKAAILGNVIEGKKKGNADTSLEERLLDELRHLLNEKDKKR
ncbi:MAG: SAM-dependent methyltransferase [Clostridia bacterium]|nr:SAM-dependent methyltransferase [Clostridia bacterium]